MIDWLTAGAIILAFGAIAWAMLPKLPGRLWITGAMMCLDSLIATEVVLKSHQVDAMTGMAILIVSFAMCHRLSFRATSN